MNRKPVSLGDIAKAAKMSRSGVSYALRNHPGIPEKTRERVRKIADLLGYIPDARIMSAMEGVRQAKSRTAVPLAWLNMGDDPGIWHNRKWLEPYWKGASDQAQKFGYRLEEIWLHEKGMTARRVSQILYSRGIQGIVLAPPAFWSSTHLRLEWKHFACVSFERVIVAPRVHRVIPDYFYNMLLTLKRLRRYGYRRVGVFLLIQMDRRTHSTYQAAMGVFQSALPPEERLPLGLASEHIDIGHDEDYVKKKLKAWLKETRPDVVVCHDSRMVGWLEAFGHKVPEKVGVVHLALDGDCMDWAGIQQRKYEIGCAAVERLVALLQNYQFGLPEVAQDTIIQGVWHPGKTLLIPKPKPPARRVSARLKATA